MYCLLHQGSGFCVYEFTETLPEKEFKNLILLSSLDHCTGTMEKIDRVRLRSLSCHLLYHAQQTSLHDSHSVELCHDRCIKTRFSKHNTTSGGCVTNNPDDNSRSQTGMRKTGVPPAGIKYQQNLGYENWFLRSMSFAQERGALTDVFCEQGFNVYRFQVTYSALNQLRGY